MKVPGPNWMRWRVRLGYPIAALAFWLALPTPAALAAGAVVAVGGLLIRGAAAGHLRKHEELATSGPYAWTRNPLYLGSAFLATGFLIVGNSLALAAIVTIYFSVFYAAVMSREAAELRERYGAAFDEYAAQVPLFFPRPRVARGRASASEARFSWARYRRNREYQAALATLLALAALAAKMMLWK